MRRFLFILAALFSAATVCGQGESNTEALRFAEKSWNFGQIEETGGIVSHTFAFTNRADHPVVIERVYTSCGCTSTDYPRQPLRPGASGTFTVNYDPDGRPGRFEKHINIYYDGGRGNTELTVKGVVNPRPHTVEEDYPFTIGGGVRADAIYRAFGNTPQGHTKSMTVALVNTSDAAVSLAVEPVERSGLLEIDMPDRLKAGEKVLATLTYVMGKQPRYGIIGDSFRIAVDGRTTDAVISTSAIGIDDFKGNGRTAPKMRITPVFYNFGTVGAPSRQNIEITVSNEGDAPLVIRSVECRKDTRFGLKAGDVIEAGESRTVTMTFSVGAEAVDSVFGGAIIVCNDPARPMRELRVTADVKQ